MEGNVENIIVQNVVIYTDFLHDMSWNAAVQMGGNQYTFLIVEALQKIGKQKRD